MDKQFQPLAAKFPVVNADGTPTLYFIRWAQERQLEVAGDISEQRALDLITSWGDGHSINTEGGLQGGGTLSSNPTLSLTDTGVAPGAYTNANITVDEKGRVTEVSSGTGVTQIYMPLVAGDIPPTFIVAPDGSLIYGAVS